MYNFFNMSTKTIRGIEHYFDMISLALKKIDADNEELRRENHKLQGQIEALSIKLSNAAISKTVEKAESSQAPPKNNMLGIAEAADYLDCSKGNMYRLHSTGIVKGYKAGKKVRFKVEDLENYMLCKSKKTIAELEAEAAKHCLKRKKP